MCVEGGGSCCHCLLFRRSCATCLVWTPAYSLQPCIHTVWLASLLLWHLHGCTKFIVAPEPPPLMPQRGL